MATNSKLKAKALDWANKIRRKDGKGELASLPKGKRYRVTMCPLAVATERNIGGVKGKTVPLPLYILDFITLFDQGAYPELIEK
jgi:hypothetical protein